MKFNYRNIGIMAVSLVLGFIFPRFVVGGTMITVLLILVGMIVVGAAHGFKINPDEAFKILVGFFVEFPEAEEEKSKVVELR